MRRPQPAWMSKIKVGSVLRNRRGTDYRVVRAVSRYSNGDLSCVTLAIRRCSWTGRPVTTLKYTDLQYAGYELMPGVRVKLDRLVDYQLEQSMRAPTAQDCLVDCCAVKGVL